MPDNEQTTAAEAPPVAPAADETIKIVEAPPEVTGVDPAFHTPTPEELKHFPPPPSLELPPTVPAAAIAVPGAPQAMDDKSAAGGVVMGTRSEPPQVIETRTPPPPPPPAFDDLPEKTKAEMRAGRSAVGGSLEAGALAEAVLRQAPHVDPSAGAGPRLSEAPPAPSPVDLSALPERTRLEIEAGRTALARKTADYKAVTDEVASKAAKRLEEGAPASPNDLDYPRG